MNLNKIRQNGKKMEPLVLNLIRKEVDTKSQNLVPNDVLRLLNRFFRANYLQPTIQADETWTLCKGPTWYSARAMAWSNLQEFGIIPERQIIGWPRQRVTDEQYESLQSTLMFSGLDGFGITERKSKVSSEFLAVVNTAAAIVKSKVLKSLKRRGRNLIAFDAATDAALYVGSLFLERKGELHFQADYYLKQHFELLEQRWRIWEKGYALLSSAESSVSPPRYLVYCADPTGNFEPETLKKAEAKYKDENRKGHYEIHDYSHC